MVSVELYTEPTPNPNALKFVLNASVKDEGRSTFRSLEECDDIPLAVELFKVRGVDHIHFFQNVITVTKFGYEDWEVLEPKVLEVVGRFLPEHDPGFQDRNPEEERRKKLPVELQEIEKILDNTIRPGLQADGGDLRCVDYRDNVLVINYEGACGNCPSSQYGTLQAIQSLLRAEYNPEIEVLAPQMEAFSGY
ncbi:MAG: NifU family protein [Bacteriovoracales bacterium]|nr:NifU family protein [Bacteriovoracales bacterium]